MPTWFETMCRRECLRRVGFWVSVLAIGILILGANVRYAKNFLRGPYETSAEQLQALSSPAATSRFFVRVAGSEVLDTGIHEITVRKRSGVEVGRSVSFGYYGLLVGKRFLIVKSSSQPGATVQGQLVDFPEGLRSNLASSIGPDVVQQRVYPFLLETEGFRTAGYWAIAIVILLGLCLYGFARPALKRLQDISTHPVMQRVQKWGDLIGLSAQAEKEYRDGVYYEAGGVRVADKFVFVGGFFTFNVFRFWDLLWVYKKVIRHSVNLIPTGKTYEAVLMFYGGAANVGGKEAKVEEILQYSAQRAPWAAFGFSDEVQKLFTKQTADFCAAIENRRQEILKR